MRLYRREYSRKKNLNAGFTTERVMEKKKSLTHFSSKTSFSHPGVWKYCVYLQLHMTQIIPHGRPTYISGEES